MASIPTLQLPTHLKERLVRGHPWVYRNHVPPQAHFPTGAWVRLRCGNWSGVAIWDAEGPIALRVYSERSIPDAAWFRRRVQDAWELRAPVRETCTAYRWLFGEGDGLPGLTVDRYGDYAVALAYSRGVATLLPHLSDALRACDPMLRGIVTRRRSDADEDDTNEIRSAGSGRAASLLWGEAPPDEVIV
ncbi:MAG TPA: class I SAM-dependent rRNA methyltransferase, partial [Roseiflexaceae bacterium]|nr:class I SAM-dependent rRNA methyltransferase [Roseiflexaceae bacterium]